MKKLFSIMLIVVMVLTITASAVSALEYYEADKKQPYSIYTQTFTDVSTTHWAFKFIAEMNKRGVISGYPNGYYYPDNNVTRAEFAKIMTLAAGLKVNSNPSSAYIDVSTTDWYAAYIESARYYLSGYIYPDGSYYKPNSNALREDIAVALVKLKGYSTAGYDEEILKTVFKDYLSISEDARKYVSVAVEKGLVSGYEDNTFRGQLSVSRAEAATLLWRAYQFGDDNKIYATNSPIKEVITPIPTVAPTETPKPTEPPTAVPDPATPAPTAPPTLAPTAAPTLAPTAPPTPIPVTVTATTEYYPKYTGTSVSIVDGLKNVGVDSSYSNRANIAKINGISNYAGTPAQNTQLLNLLKAGKLIKSITTASIPSTPAPSTPKPSTPAPSTSTTYYPRYTGSSSSIVEGLNAVGVDSSYANRTNIAKVNGISNYAGTAAQNTQMLNLLKAGQLIKASGSNASQTQPTTPSTNGNILSNNITVSSNYLSYVMKQPYSGPCAAYSYAMGLSIVRNKWHDPMKYYYNGFAHYDDGGIGAWQGTDWTKIYDAVTKGKPTMVHFFYSKSEHWVLVVGVYKGSDTKNLKANNFMILDPATGTQRTLGEGYSGVDYSGGMKIFL